MQYPLSNLRGHDGKLLDDDDDKLISDALIEPDDAFVVELKEDGDWLVDATEQLQPNTPQLFDSVDIPPPLFGPHNDYFANKFPNTKSTQMVLASTATTSGYPLRSSPFASSATRKGPAQQAGTIGLGNLSVYPILLFRIIINFMFS